MQGMNFSQAKAEYTQPRIMKVNSSVSIKTQSPLSRLNLAKK